MTRKSIDLLLATPPEWVDVVLADFDAFIQDHANCERKASALAMSLVVKHPDRTRIVPTLIALAQEELEHFREVYVLMQSRGLALVKDTQDPYVNQLMACMRHGREARFLDRLLVASLVECRGAERFRLIADALEDPPLKAFYTSLTKAETKHGHQFVDMALAYVDPAQTYARLQALAEREAEIVQGLTWRASLH
ncbi:MAG: tRNA-(ms[2]io[6]A)-hydroxylase [Gammaproteobacteria bacterium]|nr:tRNA-(ms[2]io[6]A)-hydroxylase [Gammaproteobacteria bacterium]NIR23628.1 tRNA-(ms[2]io[6]A)-hydroxylase [Gammaproteobacteria bacterium]NIS05441.1 tRNA-(ms[2]io[6]A)-hydroxylase [Gammaproteobacteria bacterium]NIU41825.1 tRNA-(ms[2]io[6]A)-hydroxylase [Gammaproteobacteria bacterium]NIV47555.1 tRNA-(ms[2]io[6]A)-hydroxylase [Gammaproteobacteria bacterium]